LFLLVNATLFIRPSEIIPGLDVINIYLILSLACVAASLPAVINRLTGRALAMQPGVLCVLGILPAIVLSDLAHGATYYARVDSIEFVKKVLIYFLLLIGLIDSPA